ncbi:MAG: hypothetical protein RJB10_107 [Pseudomonadota bacterium]
MNKLTIAKQIVVLGTGGTIAGKSASATDNVDYKASEVGVEALLAAIPALADSNGKASYAGCELVCEQVAQVDSKDMTFEVWQRLLARCTHWLAQPQVQGIVITHGTDTLEETAFFLHSVLEVNQLLAKPVVLTCAMRPSTAVAPDGPQNLLDALAVASSDQINQVVAVCASTIHSAVDVQKVHNYRLDAFSSGDAGVLGYVKEGKLAIYRNIYKKNESNMPLASVNAAYKAINNIANLKCLPRVEGTLCWICWNNENVWKSQSQTNSLGLWSQRRVTEPSAKHWSVLYKLPKPQVWWSGAVRAVRLVAWWVRRMCSLATRVV